MGFSGLFDESHPCLFEGLSSFLFIASGTGTDQILPGIRSPSSLGDDMIRRQGTLHLSAVLTLVMIPLDDILPREGNHTSGGFDKEGEPDDTGKRKSP